MKHKIILLTLCAVLLLPSCAGNGPTGWEEKEPVYTLSDFDEITPGMTYTEIVNSIGAPTGSEGVGMIWRTYELADGSYVRMFFDSDDTLASMCMVDANGMELAWEK